MPDPFAKAANTSKQGSACLDSIFPISLTLSPDFSASLSRDISSFIRGARTFVPKMPCNIFAPFFHSPFFMRSLL